MLYHNQATSLSLPIAKCCYMDGMLTSIMEGYPDFRRDSGADRCQL